jgi:Protein of unknown function (DUF3224)
MLLLMSIPEASVTLDNRRSENKYFQPGLLRELMSTRAAIEMTRFLIAAIALFALTVIAQQPTRFSPEVTRKNGTMSHAHGSFDVKLTPQKPDSSGAMDAGVARLSLDKQFHGDLEGTSKGEMLSAMSADVKNSGVYVALERVTGTLAGRSGSFVLYHTGVMDRGQQNLSINVVPDSGTGDLKGITGKFTIVIEPDGKHFYDFGYDLPAK